MLLIKLFFGLVLHLLFYTILDTKDILAFLTISLNTTIAAQHHYLKPIYFIYAPCYSLELEAIHPDLRVVLEWCLLINGLVLLAEIFRHK